MVIVCPYCYFEGDVGDEFRVIELECPCCGQTFWATTQGTILLIERKKVN